ncbi:hypothetical protein B0H19DRAFT_1123456 [Mycena capillaripes]|nr:hypothetical protein B0H19DRAFT_1123456 [Mycena capillaripes]
MLEVVVAAAASARARVPPSGPLPPHPHSHFQFHSHSQRHQRPHHPPHPSPSPQDGFAHPPARRTDSPQTHVRRERHQAPVLCTGHTLQDRARASATSRVQVRARARGALRMCERLYSSSTSAPSRFRRSTAQKRREINDSYPSATSPPAPPAAETSDAASGGLLAPEKTLAASALAAGALRENKRPSVRAQLASGTPAGAERGAAGWGREEREKVAMQRRGGCRWGCGVYMRSLALCAVYWRRVHAVGWRCRGVKLRVPRRRVRWERCSICVRGWR